MSITALLCIDGINIKRDVKNWFESEGFTRIENIIEQKLKNVPIGKYNNKGVCFVSISF